MGDFFYALNSDYGSSRCEKLQAPSYLNLALSILILLGILISYLPQHYRIIARGTSEGISPYFILLGTTSGTCAFANILALPASRADVQCCKVVSTFECSVGLLGIAQVGVQWFCFSVILLLFLVFFPRTPRLPLNDTVQRYTWRMAVTVALICLLHGFIVVVVSVGLAVARPHHLGAWANLLGITATLLAVVQYLPQILLTWRLGHVGSLSIPMMLIQTPGSFVWSASLAVRLGSEGWSTWGVFLVTGCLQGCLLAMGIAFELKARRLADELAANCVHAVGYFPEGAVTGTYDEEEVIVEASTTERTLLLNGSGRPSKNGVSSQDEEPRSEV